jgi:hypothetical protein
MGFTRFTPGRIRGPRADEGVRVPGVSGPYPRADEGGRKLRADGGVRVPGKGVRVPCKGVRVSDALEEMYH